MHILLHDVPLQLFKSEKPPPSLLLAPPVNKFEIIFVKVLRSVFQSWRSRQKRKGKFRIFFSRFLHFNFFILIWIRLSISIIITIAKVPSVARRFFLNGIFEENKLNILAFVTPRVT